MTVRPWMTALAFCFAGMFTIGYLARHLLSRPSRRPDRRHDGTPGPHAARLRGPDLRPARPGRPRHLAASCSTSRSSRRRWKSCCEQQVALTSRNGKLGHAARTAPRMPASTRCSKQAELPTRRAARRRPAQPIAAPARRPSTSLLGARGRPNAARKRPSPRSPTCRPASTVADRADRLFSNVTLSLKDIEREQIAQIQQPDRRRGRDAPSTSQTILPRTGVDAPVDQPTADAEGGRSAAPSSSPQTGDRVRGFARTNSTWR